MKVRTEHRGRHLPFERERQIILQRLPVGATITRATITVTPQPTDPERRFLETIAFPDGVGDWGASKTTTATAVEVDLHARRKLAELAGPNLDNATLLVDLGGGFMVVNDAGGLGPGGPFRLTAGTTDLPGLTVTGLRLAKETDSHPNLSLLRIASPPSNVSLAVAGGPTFWTYSGDLVDPQTTPDFAGILQAMLPDLEVANGYHLVPFVIRSDSIARLDLALEIEHTVTVSGLPDGVPSVQLPYAFNGSPETAQGQLALAVPPGLAAVPGATTGRVQGAFEATRVLHGPLGPVLAPEQPLISGTGPLAQPFALAAAELTMSVDLLLTAVTAEVTLSVDLVDDLDGKPGRTSLLPVPSRLSVNRAQAPRPAWLTVPLAAAVSLGAGDRHWLVVQALVGTAAWGAVPGGPGLQQTRDGGLSWRAVTGETGTGPLAAQLRLRQATPAFHMPLELRVGSGPAQAAVSLQRFAAQGAVDLELDFPEVAVAVNRVLTSSRSGVADGAEHVANGNFTEWHRVGIEVTGAGSLDGGDRIIQEAVFSPDGATVYAAGRGMNFFAFDPFCLGQLYVTQLGPGVPDAMVVEPSGRRVLVASELNGRPLLTIVDTATGVIVGTPVATLVTTPERFVALAMSADGSAVYALGQQHGEAVVRRLPWASLIDAATSGSTFDVSTYPRRPLGGQPRGLTVSPGGRVVVATVAAETVSTLHSFAADLSLPGSREATTVNDVRDVAATASGAEVLVLGQRALSVVRSSDLGELFTATVGASGIRLGVDPDGGLALVLEDDVLETFDLRRRALKTAQVSVFGGRALVMSPAGAHAVVIHNSPQATLLSLGPLQPADWELTAGRVRPWCLSATSGPLALLGVAIRGGDGEPSAISQVVPAVAGARYRFVFDGITNVEGAVGELAWRAGDCGQLRTDRVLVNAPDLERSGLPDRLPRHELVTIAPPTATQVEIRFQTGAGVLGVDAVSLTGSSDALSDPTAQAGAAWQPSAPSLTVTPSEAGATLANGGPTSAMLSQVIAAPGGQHFVLHVSARIGELIPDGPAIEVVFRDDTARPIGPVVRLGLDVLAFDQRAASGLVPSGTTEAEVRVIVPPGGVVELSELSLVLGAMTEVELGFVSEAPGQLTVSRLAVGLDDAPSAPAPMPPGGLCRATPPGRPGQGEECYCPRCGQQRLVKRAVPVLTDSGRPGSVAPCPACGTQRVRVGGPLVASAESVGLPRFLATRGSGPARTRPRSIASVHVDAPLAAIPGIGPAREAELRAAGIGSITALAEAGEATVAALPGVSARMAAAFIRDAAQLVRDHGTCELFGVP